MSRAARLLDLVQALRRRRHAVPASVLAGEPGVSPRTVHRDIAALAAQGAPIEARPASGHVLRPGLPLPTLMPAEDEVDAGGPARDIDRIRQVLRAERKPTLRYADKAGAATERKVWPLALGFFAEAEVPAARCELRRGFRHFRLDRIVEAAARTSAFPGVGGFSWRSGRAAEGIGTSDGRC